MAPWGLLVDIASGVLFVALGAAVLSVDARRRENRLFAGFAVAYGLAFVAFNAQYFARDLGFHVAVASYAALVTATAATTLLVVLASRVPAPVSPAERRRMGLLRFLPAAWAGVHLVGFTGFLRSLGDEVVAPLGIPASEAPHVFWGLVGNTVVWAGLLYFGFLMAARYHALEDVDAAGKRRQVALLAAAMLTYPLLAGGGLLGFPQAALPAPMLLIPLGGAVLLALLWLRATSGPGAALARRMAWFSLAVPLAGMVAVVLAGGEVVTRSGLMGVARVIGAAVLAYAIVRHQVLGLDVKVRWTISRGTTAAIFIATFFIVGEAAQAFFADRAGSQYLGIAAAGLLIFAIAPLQRIADRLAEKAVPVPASSDALATYREAVRVALADGTVGREEERALARLAASLRVDPAQALDVREEVEREQAG